MKICILTPRFPFPENGGDVLRINNIARYLKSKGHSLVLCSFYESNITDDALSEAKDLYDVVHSVKRNKIVSLLNVVKSFFLNAPLQCGYYSSHSFLVKFKEFVVKETPDLYISHLLRMTQYLEKLSLESKSIVEMTDALSKTYNLLSSKKGFSFKKVIYSMEKSRIQKYEQMVIKSFPKVALVSKEDIAYLGNHQNLAFYTNGINCIENNNLYNSNKICFVGNMRTLQNQDAVMTFVNDIFPFIKKRNPNAEFHIVGAQPSDEILALHDNKTIFVTGFVNSVEDYIKDACVVVAPVNIAAGIQNKVLIGMGCRIPVILTPLISKAIPELQNEVNCFITEDWRDFAHKCVLLMNDSELRNNLAIKGYEMVKRNYSWNENLNNYELL